MNQLEEILEIDPDLVFTLFDRSHLGMARAAGLRGIIKMIKIFTKNHFDAIQ